MVVLHETSKFIKIYWVLSMCLQNLIQLISFIHWRSHIIESVNDWMISVNQWMISISEYFIQSQWLTHLYQDLVFNNTFFIYV